MKSKQCQQKTNSKRINYKEAQIALIRKDLTIPTLARRYNISRNMMWKVFKNYRSPVWILDRLEQDFGPGIFLPD